VLENPAFDSARLGINLLGDWLRDYLDPELRHVM
jgi:ABC-type dipeptide/oligopeptide/nickel transport system permease subunit